MAGRVIRETIHSLRSAAALGTIVMLLLTGCHTTAGFGQDLQSTGRNIENSANKANK